jgi:hypothetical protein
MVIIAQLLVLKGRSLSQKRSPISTKPSLISFNNAQNERGSVVRNFIWKAAPGALHLFGKQNPHKLEWILLWSNLT